MENYYDILKIHTNSSAAEIESAIDKLFNHWRKLVTHHDPNIVMQANHSLQIIEQIRATLTNPEKRASYDLSIGLGETTAGLADPEAFLRNLEVLGVLTPPSNMGNQTSKDQRNLPRIVPGLWTCPVCKTENPEKTEHCFKCGAIMLRECPECHNMTSLLSTGICGKCGYPYEIAQQRSDLKNSINLLEHEVHEVEVDRSREISRLPKLGVISIIFRTLALIYGLIAFLLAGNTIDRVIGLALFLIIAVFFIRKIITISKGKNRILEIDTLLPSKRERLNKFTQTYKSLERK